jgi:hypothetical protein
MRVEEQRVHTPRERLQPSVQVIVLALFRQVSVMFSTNVCLVLSMLLLYSTNP